MANTHRVGFVAVVLTLVLCLAAVILIGPQGSDQSSEDQASQSANESANGEQPAPTEPNSDEARAELATKATGFLESYYLIKPTDSEETRRARVLGFVPEDLIASLDLGLAIGTPADQARVKNRVTITGKVRRQQMRIEQGSADEKDMILSVPVTVSQTKPGGKRISRYVVPTVSLWNYERGNWTLRAFNEGGDTE